MEGPGGIGKTTLCLAAIHHPGVMLKFPTRHFLSCEASTTVDEVVSIVGGSLGILQSGNLIKRVIQELTKGPPCILVLDNFETVWEPPASRKEVEEFLSLLANISHVALLVSEQLLPG